MPSWHSQARLTPRLRGFKSSPICFCLAAKKKKKSTKSPKAVFGCSLKNERMILAHFQGKPFSITVIQVYAPNTNAKKAVVEQFDEDLQDLLELKPENMSSSS